MTTGKRFQYCGQSPSDRINRLQKEVELLELEIHGHREVLLRLRHVQEMVMLTTEQAGAVREEMTWRSSEMRHLGETRRLKVTAIHGWKLRQSEARKRTATAGHEETRVTVIENLHLNRPVRHPPEQEARLCLARDLCRRQWVAHGYDHAKFIHMLQLPLFQVALGGQASMLEVYAQAQALARNAA